MPVAAASAIDPAVVPAPAALPARWRDIEMEQALEHSASRTILVVEDEDARRGGAGDDLAFGICDDSATATAATPLLQSTKRAMLPNADLRQRMAAMALSDDERSAVVQDLYTPTMAIVRDEGRHLVRLSLPMMVAALLELVPDTLLSMMIGKLDPHRSTQLLAAFSLASLFRILLISGVFQGLSSAIDTLCAQAFGGKRLRELWMFTQAGCIMYAACFPFLTVVLLNGARILVALGQDPVISHIAAHLLVVSLIAMPFTVLFVIVKSVLQAQNIVLPFVYASAISWSISIPIAYVLGYYTRLGYMGLVLAIALSDIIKSLTLVVVLLRNDVFRSAWPGWCFREALGNVAIIARLGISSVLMVTFQTLGISVTSLLAGMLEDVAVMISANSIFLSCLMLAFMPLFGICIAGAVRMGNALGAGKARRASLVGRVVIGSCMTVATIGMVITSWIAEPYAHAFTSNTEAIRIATKMVQSLLIIIPLLGFVFGFQSILRASGKQWLCAKMNFAFLFVISVPVGVLIAVKLHQSITGLWYGQCVGLVCFLVAGCVWLYRASWDDMAQQARRNMQT